MHVKHTCNTCIYEHRICKDTWINHCDLFLILVVWPLIVFGKNPLKSTFSYYFTSPDSSLKLSILIYAPPFVIYLKIILHTLLSKDIKIKQATFFLKCQYPEWRRKEKKTFFWHKIIRIMFFLSVVLSKTNILTCTHKGIKITENASLQESDTYSRVFLAILIVQKKWRCIYSGIQEEMRLNFLCREQQSTVTSSHKTRTYYIIDPY